MSLNFDHGVEMRKVSSGNNGYTLVSRLHELFEARNGTTALQVLARRRNNFGMITLWLEIDWIPRTVNPAFVRSSAQSSWDAARALEVASVIAPRRSANRPL
jgi:hypothetical protein